MTTESLIQRTFAMLLVAALLPTACVADAETFRSRVAPILRGRCVECHSGEDPKGGYSLESFTKALSGDMIRPGDAQASHLLDLITPVDGHAAMPKNASPLSAEQIGVIRRWIEAGADWPTDLDLSPPKVDRFDWWSYRPITRPAVPEVDEPWARTPIDRFIAARSYRIGLRHARPADRQTLIRRVTYDLIGLPPTPQQVAEFVADPDPMAYEALVDRLLTSKHYGERWARHWLDIVKYADTCGYDKDKLRHNAWPYRDYVIRSLNEDKPYSRFVQEQIAGDALFPNQPDGILGLGFIAAGPWDHIGHVEVAESKIDGKVARNLDRDDMVSNALNTFCSVTVQCARCHDHKFDPITQEDYYGLQSIFAAVDRADRPYDLDPEVERERQVLQSQIRRCNDDLAELEQQILHAGGERLRRLNERIGKLKSQVQIEQESAFGYHAKIATDADLEQWVQVGLDEPAELSMIVLNPCHDNFGGIGAGFGFPRRFTVDVRAGDDSDWVTVVDHGKADFPNPGIKAVEIELGSMRVRQTRVTATRLMKRSNDYNFALAEVQLLDRDGVNVAIGADVTSLDSIEAPVRWARQNLTDGLFPRHRDPDAAEELSTAQAKRVRLLESIETEERVERRLDLQSRITESRKRLKELPEGRMVYAAATHFAPRGKFKPTEGNPRPVHVLGRGDVTRPGSLAIPRLLPLDQRSEWSLPSESGEAERRASLARWLTSESNPLVWRSIVNRVWQYHFGEGLVATSNDFGRMGARPSHPRLLDWLASEFRDGGQSLKSLHRMICTSSVYRQASSHDSHNTKIDANNRFLWRMNRRRLSAEEVRDSILTISGTLDITMGGPGFYLFELEKTTHSPHYEYHKFDPADPTTHRRSVYRFIVRSQPDPWMAAFDCADSSQSTPRRTETLTSLQALSLLNNRFILAMSERFADRLEQEDDDRRRQVVEGLRLVLQRPPDEEEISVCLTYAERHGLKNLCRYLINLNEFVFVD